MLKVGTAAPDFRVEDHEGNIVTRDSLLADGPFILFFYPADFTRVCTLEVCMFRDQLPELSGHGIRVFGVSPQTSRSHQKFRKTHDLTYPLLCDPDMKMAAAYAARGPLGLVMKRVTYLVNAQGSIADRASGLVGLRAHESLLKRALAD